MRALLWAFVLVVGSLAVQAQPAAKVFRIGVVFASVPPSDLLGNIPINPAAAAVIKGLEDYGWVRGKNIEIFWRTAEAKHERLPALIEELVQLPVDILIVNSEGMTAAALSKTRRIPIVMATSEFPVKWGVIESLARPGGNVTGLTHTVGPDVQGKRLALLKQAAPSVTRVAFLTPVRGRSAELLAFPPELLAAAGALRISIFQAPFETADQIEGAIDHAVQQGANALFVVGQSELNRLANRAIVNRTAQRHRLPAMYCTAGNEGDFMSYAPDGTAGYRRAGYFVDRILKGANPGEMPIEQPSAFHLTVNVKAAREIGLTFPQSILVQADRLID